MKTKGDDLVAAWAAQASRLWHGCVCPLCCLTLYCTGSSFTEHCACFTEHCALRLNQVASPACKQTQALSQVVQERQQHASMPDVEAGSGGGAQAEAPAGRGKLFGVLPLPGGAAHMQQQGQQQQGQQQQQQEQEQQRVQQQQEQQQQQGSRTQLAAHQGSHLQLAPSVPWWYQVGVRVCCCCCRCCACCRC